MIVSDTRAFQQVLGVGDTSILPDWLVVGVTVGTCDVQTSKTQQANYNVFHGHAGGLSETWFKCSMQSMNELIVHQRDIAGCDSVHDDKSSKRET